MKAIFLIICLLNILFFFWEFYKGALNSQITPQAHLPAILLADELERAKRGAELSRYLDKDLLNLGHLQIVGEIGLNKPVLNPLSLGDKGINQISPVKPIQTDANTAKPLAEPEETQETHPVAEIQSFACFDIGPFPDNEAASSWLRTQVFTGEIVTKEILLPSSYLVYYPTDKEPEQNRVHRMMLKAKGINDIWVVTSGELKGALSLGLYNEKGKAEYFRKQLLQRGVQTEIQERYKSQSRLFVRVRIDSKLQHQLNGAKVVSCEQ